VPGSMFEKLYQSLKVKRNTMTLKKTLKTPQPILTEHRQEPRTSVGPRALGSYIGGGPIAPGPGEDLRPLPPPSPPFRPHPPASSELSLPGGQTHLHNFFLLILNKSFTALAVVNSLEFAVKCPEESSPPL
jgi:hypothetical protein